MQTYEKNYPSGMAIMEESSSHSVRLLFIIFVKRSLKWHQKEPSNEPLKMRSKMSSQDRSPLGDESASFCQHRTEGETKPTCSGEFNVLFLHLTNGILSPKAVQPFLHETKPQAYGTFASKLASLNSQ